MPNQTPLERAKAIAAQRLAARKKTAAEWSQGEVLPGTTYPGQLKDNDPDSKIWTKYTPEFDLSVIETNGSFRWWAVGTGSMAGMNYSGEGFSSFEEAAAEADGFDFSEHFASVKTALNWEQDSNDGAGYDSGESWDVESDGFFASVFYFDGTGSYEVYDQSANSSDAPVSSGSCSSVEDGKSKVEEFISSAKTSSTKEGKTLSDSRVASRKEVLEKATAREAAVKAAQARRQAARKAADVVDPAVPGGEPDEHLETVDVEQQVSVAQETDHTPEQVSDETGKGGDDSTIAMDPEKSKNENGSNATIGFDPAGNSNKKSKVEKVSSAKVAELTDLYLESGIIAAADKYNTMASFEVLGNAVVQDRIDLLKQVKAASAKRVASTGTRPLPRVQRSTPSPRMGTRPVTSRTASVDSATDVLVTLPSFGN